MARPWAVAGLLVALAATAACVRVDTGAVEGIHRQTVTTRCPAGDPLKTRCVETTTVVRATVDKRGWVRVSPAVGNDPDTDAVVIELLQD